MRAMNAGSKMYKWCVDLFPLNRSLSGDANRETLMYIKKILPNLEILNYPTDQPYFDWMTPKEWNVQEAYIEDSSGTRIIDWKENNLHLVGYSIPVDKVITKEELLQRTHTVEEMPDAIPYKTSYYSPSWGFCISENQLKSLTNDKYRVVIKSKLEKGSLVCGEVVYPGKSKNEILLSSYICHPSMANNELSGPAVLTALLKLIEEDKDRYYTYRATFHPETIGAISYIERHQLHKKNNVIAAWNFTCMGGPDSFSLLPSKYSDSLPERITRKAFRNLGIEFKLEDFLLRGSDERQYESPNVEIPTISVMKSMYGKYPEYHTSLDNLSFISAPNLELSLNVMSETIRILERSRIYKSIAPCEPFLSKHGLEKGVAAVSGQLTFRDFLNVHMYCDGKNTTDDLAKLCKLIPQEVEMICEILIKQGIIN